MREDGVERLDFVRLDLVCGLSGARGRWMRLTRKKEYQLVPYETMRLADGERVKSGTVGDQLRVGVMRKTAQRLGWQ